MVFLRILVDEIDVATVDTAGREVVAVHVGGTRVDEDYADLNVSGGVYGHEGQSNHRIWVNQMPLRIGQTVAVELLEHGIANGSGQTIEELYPDHKPELSPPSTSRAELFDELRRASQIRSGYTVRLVPNDGSPTTLVTTSAEHGFGFSALWNNLHPNRMSVSLHTYTIDGVEAEMPGRDTYRGKLGLGSNVRLQLVA
jgi:hypothetical protein